MSELEHERRPPTPGQRYCLITPFRDEAAFIRSTLETVSKQSVAPALWILVDDGSSDGSAEIVAEYAARFDFIRLYERGDRGARLVGPGVVDAFYHGLSQVNLSEFDFVCKLDADLELPLGYFERVMQLMSEDPLLGNLSGKLYERLADGSLFQERTGDENAVGPVKFYRVACFQEIGGFVRGVCWDGIDGHICRMKGWLARSVDDPELRIIHLRPMGSSQQSIFVGRVRWGSGKYFMGSAWYYTLAAALYRSVEPPWAAAGACMVYGYARELLRRGPRYDNPEYQRYLRRFELESLLTGKRRTLHRHEKRIRERKA